MPPIYRNIESGQEVVTDARRSDLEEAARWERLTDDGGYGSGPKPADSSAHIGGPGGYEQTGGEILMSSLTAGMFSPDFIRSPEFLEGYEKWEGRTKPLEPLFLDKPKDLDPDATDEEKAKHEADVAAFDEEKAEWVAASEDTSNIEPNEEAVPPVGGVQGAVPAVAGPAPEPARNASRATWIKYLSEQLHVAEGSLAQFSRDELVEKYATA